ncbi:MAG TPA: phosphotransferase [Verrucomicrobiae bacterium]|nr:phosphotransferase [Verrucomicrobiae bacterium]
MPNPIDWNQIEANLHTMTHATGGFSQAQRGLVGLPGGGQVFVKIGTEENSKAWAKKEVAVYRYLQDQSYTAIPALLAASPDQTAFSLEALKPEDGWDWSETWTAERLAATLQAMDDLAALQPKHEDWMSLGQVALDEGRDGWGPLAQSTELQQELREKLKTAGQSQIAEALDFTAQAERTASFVFRTDTLVHYDVRADNCAWNPVQKQVKLVDWNWTQLGDTRVDSSAMLAHVQRTGLDVYPLYADRLDADALHWLAGFWLRAAITPIWPDGPAHLRDMQLQVGITALGLAHSIE